MYTALSNQETSGHGMMEGIFQKVEKGKCKIAFNGQIAIWTSHGYKTFSPDTGSLVNCSNFVAEMGDDFFYVMPAAKVKTGDIILVGGLPRCVIKAEKNLLTVMTYETGAIENIIPERQIFMGSIFFYRKIVSPMMGMFGGKHKAKGMLKMMMLSDFMTGGKDKNQGNGAGLVQLLMIQGMMKDMEGSMDTLFDLFEEEDDDSEEE